MTVSRIVKFYIKYVYSIGTADEIDQKCFCDCTVAVMRMFISCISARKKNLSYKGSIIFDILIDAWII